MFRSRVLLSLTTALGLVAAAPNPPPAANDGVIVEWNQVSINYPLGDPTHTSVIATFVRSSQPALESISRIVFEKSGKHYEIADDRLLKMRLRDVAVSFVKTFGADDFSLMFPYERTDGAATNKPPLLEIIVRGMKHHEIILHPSLGGSEGG